MDILTPRGQSWKNYAEEAVWVFESQYGEEFGIALTDWRKPVSYDGCIVRKKTKTICAALEIKCRSMTLGKLVHEYRGEWLVTLEKLKEGQKAAANLGVPFFGLLYLVPERRLLIRRLTDGAGRLIHVKRTEETVTKATCNGGEARRMNAFIDMRGATIVEGKSKDASTLGRNQFGLSRLY